jgi:hypothetical protein
MDFDNFEDLEDIDLTPEEAQEATQIFTASVCTFVDDEGT